MADEVGHVQGKLAAPDPAAGAGRARRVCQRPVASEDGLVQRAQLGSRVDAKLVGQQTPYALVRPQRVGLPATPVQSGHQLRPERLSQRVPVGQDPQFGHELGMPAERKVRLDLPVERVQALFGQPCDRVAVQRLRGHVGQRLAAPLRQRLAQDRRLRVAVSPVGRLAGPLQQQSKPADIDVTLGHCDHVPFTTALDQLAAAEQLAQPGDVGLDNLPRAGRQGVTPDRPGQFLHRHKLAGSQQQAGQQDPVLGRLDRHRPAPIYDLERAQQAKLHGSPRFPLRLCSSSMPPGLDPGNDDLRTVHPAVTFCFLATILT